MILGPDGKQHLDLSSMACHALCDGVVFLTHGLRVLPTVSLEPYCRQCAADGHCGTVVVTPEPDRFEFRCLHAAGRVKKNVPLDMEQLLNALNWGIRCTACLEPVAGDNAKTDVTFTVTCGCTTRRLENPARKTMELH